MDPGIVLPNGGGSIVHRAVGGGAGAWCMVGRFHCCAVIH